MIWDGLTPPYSTIVADPPWRYDEGWPEFNDRAGKPHRRKPLPYSAMPIDDIRSLPVGEIAASDAHLYLWTTNRYLRAAYGVAESWGFDPAQVLVWCKTPQGIGPGGAFAITAEFVLFCRRGKLPSRSQRVPTTWWNWPRTAHSVKPPAFGDLVEQVSPGPYVELFCRSPRMGWDSWGLGYESPALAPSSHPDMS